MIECELHNSYLNTFVYFVKTHNIKLRKNGWAGRGGLEISLCSENRFPEKTRAI